MVYALAQATPLNKQLAQAQVQRLEAGGSTLMSAGLKLAQQEFQKMPGAIHYGLFLTDGKNNDYDEAELDQTLQRCEGVFQCDCRGVGTDWQPKQLQKIALKLLGTAMIIAEPAGIEADFSAAIQNPIGHSVDNVRLRLWTPKSAKILVVKQISPDIVVLTDRERAGGCPVAGLSTGAWATSGTTMLRSRWRRCGRRQDARLPSEYRLFRRGEETKVPGTPVVASWTGDETLSARINEQVAHYTGQAELAETIQKGLEARAQGDMDSATRFLGRAAKFAATPATMRPRAACKRSWMWWTPTRERCA